MKIIYWNESLNDSIKRNALNSLFKSGIKKEFDRVCIKYEDDTRLIKQYKEKGIPILFLIHDINDLDYGYSKALYTVLFHDSISKEWVLSELKTGLFIYKSKTKTELIDSLLKRERIFAFASEIVKKSNNLIHSNDALMYQMNHSNNVIKEEDYGTLDQ